MGILFINQLERKRNELQVMQDHKYHINPSLGRDQLNFI